jgi:hypothetical protein
MTDEFAKTLVIDDADYAPGAIAPASNADKVKPDLSDDEMKTPEDVANDDGELPSFEDTSWLT